MPINHSSSLDKLLDYIPDILEKTNNMMNRCIQNKKEETSKILKEMQKKEQKQSKNKGKVEEKIDKVTEKANQIKENNENKDETYEFEYDETLEDE